MNWPAILIWAVVFGSITTAIAQARSVATADRPAGWWFVIGAIFGILAVPYALLKQRPGEQSGPPRPIGYSTWGTRLGEYKPPPEPASRAARGRALAELPRSGSDSTADGRVAKK